MTFSRFLPDLAANIIGGLASGAVLAVGAYVLIERRFRLRQDRENRAEIARGILLALAEELRHNLRIAEALLEHLPQRTLPFSGFEASGWSLVAQVPALATLNAQTVNALLDAYLRVRPANEQHRLLFDLTYGATGALSFLVAGTAPAAEGHAAFERLDTHREDLQERLVRTVENLVPYLREALARVERELAAYANEDAQPVPA